MARTSGTTANSPKNNATHRLLELAVAQLDVPVPGKDPKGVETVQPVANWRWMVATGPVRSIMMKMPAKMARATTPTSFMFMLVEHHHGEEAGGPDVPSEMEPPRRPDPSEVLRHEIQRAEGESDPEDEDERERRLAVRREVKEGPRRARDWHGRPLERPDQEADQEPTEHQLLRERDDPEIHQDRRGRIAHRDVQGDLERGDLKDRERDDEERDEQDLDHRELPERIPEGRRRHRPDLRREERGGRQRRDRDHDVDGHPNVPILGFPERGKEGRSVDEKEKLDEEH